MNKPSPSSFSNFDKRELEPSEILQEAIDDYNVDSFYVAYSGGKDSGIVLDYVAKNFPKQFKGAMFCNTGIAVKECVNFVREHCKKKNYPLFEVKTSDVLRKKDNKYGRKKGEPFTFEDLVLQIGFPKQSMHDKVMGVLKKQPMRQFINKRMEAGEKCGIIAGVRKKESKRRSMKSKKHIFKHEGGAYFISPLFYKTNSWVSEYYIKNDIKRSPVYDTLHISGDCLCGCFAQKEELKLLEMFHPETFNEIKRLEQELMKRGREYAKLYKTWGTNKEGLATQNISAQTELEEFVCSECYFDRDSKQEDTERFDNELKDIEEKLNHLSSKS